MFKDREAAGRELGKALARVRLERETLVLGLPRGGVAVASALSRELRLPLDVLVSTRLMTATRPRRAFGAITEDGIPYRDDLLAKVFGVTSEAERAEVRRRREEADGGARLYRGGRPAPLMEGRTIVLVDDGVVTGFTLLAAIETLRRRRPRRLIAAVPVGPIGALLAVQEKADSLFALACPVSLRRVADAYSDYSPVSHRDVLRLLSCGHPPRRWSGPAALRAK